MQPKFIYPLRLASCIRVGKPLLLVGVPEESHLDPLLPHHLKRGTSILIAQEVVPLVRVMERGVGDHGLRCDALRPGKLANPL